MALKIKVEDDVIMTENRQTAIDVIHVVTEERDIGRLVHIKLFDSQYPSLTVKKSTSFHDRFLILDRKQVYLVGASLKDSGGKCFGVSLLDDPTITSDLLRRIDNVP